MVRSIEIRPNRSLTRRGATWFFASLATVCLSIAIAFASLGFWVVLPFAGAELALLGLALAMSLRSAARCEVIHIDAERLVVERRPGAGSGRWEFRRPWVQVDLERPALRHYPSRLLVSQSGQVCEVGRCLTEPERTSLFARLREILNPR